MAAAMAQCVSCYGLTAKLNTLSLSPNAPFKPLSFSSNASTVGLFSRGLASVSPVQLSPYRRSIVCEVVKKKADSAAKRARQAEKRRIYNKAKKSEVRTRMKKVLEALEVLVKKQDAQPEEVIPVEKLIAEAYSAIDKAVKAGSLHRNTGARRKSRLARRKKAAEIHHGWYTPAAAAAATACYRCKFCGYKWIFVLDFEGRCYRCKFCNTQSALADDLVSRSFHYRRGKAYLFNTVVNMTAGSQEERMMITGMHTVPDVFLLLLCPVSRLKYEIAHEMSQKY